MDLVLTIGKKFKRSFKDLTEKFGRWFSVQNIERMRAFYLVYRKSSTVLSNFYSNSFSEHNYPKFILSWSHYLKLMRIDD